MDPPALYITPRACARGRVINRVVVVVVVVVVVIVSTKIMERHSGQNSCLYNRIDVSIHDIDVSITDVHVSIIDVDVSIIDEIMSTFRSWIAMFRSPLLTVSIFGGLGTECARMT